MNKMICLFLSIISIIWTLSCTDKKSPQKKTQDTEISGSESIKIEPKKQLVNSKSDVSSSEKEIINFGVTPWSSNEIMETGFKPFLEYLSEKTGRQFILNISPDYNTMNNELKSGKIQIGHFSPGAYADALKEIGDSLTYIGTTKFLNKGTEYYHGYIFTRNDSNINSISDLRGKSFAFVDKGSSSGYKFPITLFLKENINPESYFSNVFFLGFHDKVIDAVAENRVDAGATADDLYEVGIQRHGDIFTIINKTPPLPGGAWAANKNVTDKFIDELQDVLTSMDVNTKTSKGKIIFDGKFMTISGFVIRNNEFYNVISETSELLEKYEKTKLK